MVALTWRGKALPQVDTHLYRLVDQQVYLPQEPETPEASDRLASETAATASTVSPVEAWRNHLIHGDRLQALSALLPTLACQVNLIYVDPPFMTGRTFNNGERLSIATRVSYKDTWKNSLDIYLQWLYETFYCLYLLLAENGSCYIHLDWRAAHYAKIILDEIFAPVPGGGFKNEIIWHYQSGGRARKTFARKHDTILLYTKSAQYTFHSERVGPRRGAAQRNHMRRHIDEHGLVTWSIRSNGRLYSYTEDSAMSLADVWGDISHLHQKDPERTGYATQKPEALLERIVLASSEENDIVLDCCCGSGVTPAVAQRLGRRWLACDQSAVSIHVACERLRKSHLQQPFVLQYVSTIE